MTTVAILFTVKTLSLCLRQPLVPIHQLSVIECAADCARTEHCHVAYFSQSDYHCYVLTDKLITKRPETSKACTIMEVAVTGSTVPKTDLTSAAECSAAPPLGDYSSDITLHQACEEGKLNIVKYILCHGLADINSFGQNKLTPVMVAAWKGQLAVFDFLISQGCNLSLDTERGDWRSGRTNARNVLHLACCGGNTDIVRKLIEEHKFNIENEGYASTTPVMFAVRYAKKDVFDLLVKKRCNLRAVNEDNFNILFIAAARSFEMLEYVIRQRAVDINSRANKGQTAAMMIIERRTELAPVQILINGGYNVNAVDNKGYNILHIAAINNNLLILDYFARRRTVDINSKSYKGETAAILSAQRINELSAVKILANAGCNVNAVDNQGYDIFHTACKKGHISILGYLLGTRKYGINDKGGLRRAPILTAASIGQTEVIGFLINWHCDVNAVDKDDNNVLHIACQKRHVNVVKFMTGYQEYLNHVKTLVLMRNKYNQTPSQAQLAACRDIPKLLKSKSSFRA